ncbi:hypothetical protein [Alcaligenes sp. Marseille-Q7550]
MNEFASSRLVQAWRACRLRLDQWRFIRRREAYFQYLLGVLQAEQGRRTLHSLFVQDSLRYGARHHRGRLSRHWQAVYRRSGGELQAVWAGCLRPDELLVLRTAQAAGRVQDGLAALSSYLSLVGWARGQVLQLLWPAVMAVLLAVFLLACIPWLTVPALQQAFMDLPSEFLGARTASLYAWAQRLRTAAPWADVQAVAGAAGLRLVLKNRSHGLRRTMDRVGPGLVLRRLAALRFLSLLAVLLQPGAGASLPLRAAIQLLAVGSGDWMRWHLDLMLRRIAAGHRDEAFFDTGLLARELLRFLSDMTRAHGMARALSLCARQASDTLRSSLPRQALALRWFCLLAAVLFGLWLLAWHYAVLDELRRSLMLFFSSSSLLS